MATIKKTTTKTVNAMKKIETMNVTVKLIQKTSSLQIVNNQIEFTNVKQLAEKISIKILTARANLKRYNKTIKGFSFNRKFEVEINVNNKIVTFSDLFAGLDDFTTTLATNEKSFYNFANIIYDMLFNVLNGGDKETIKQILSKEQTLLLA
jgi:hypothetical protein